MKSKKVKPPSIRKLKKKLWKLVSKYVRLRDKNICFTCSRYVEGSAYHAGHFIPGSVCPPSLMYDLLNLHGQCYACNILKDGNWPSYFERMVAIHGRTKVQQLIARRGQAEKWYPVEYEREITRFKELLTDEFGIKM